MKFRDDKWLRADTVASDKERHPMTLKLFLMLWKALGLWGFFVCFLFFSKKDLMCIIVIRFPYRSVILIHFYRRMVQPRQNSICKSFLQCVLAPVLLLVNILSCLPFSHSHLYQLVCLYSSHYLLMAINNNVCSIMSDFAIPQTAAARLLYPWNLPGKSTLTFPPPGDLPDPRIELTSLTYPALADRLFTTKLCINNYYGMFQIDQRVESHLQSF